MEIIRDTTGDIVNRIVNDPDVDQGPVDLRLLVRNPHVWALVGDPPIGTHVCVEIVEGVFEFHSAVRPEGRGEWTAEFTNNAICYMFCETSCIELATRIPQGSLSATTLARQFHFSPRWTCEKMIYKGKAVPYTVWGLTMMEWMPPEQKGFVAAIDYMRKAGNNLKADVWEARRNWLSREVM